MLNYRISLLLFSVMLMQLPVRTAAAREFNVAISGTDSNAGTASEPLRTIQRAADLAQPGDIVTVHAGVYREQVSPPRGGESDAKRIVYQAAPGEKVVVTGAEIVKGWQHLENDTWKVIVPNSFFGNFNPYEDRLHGDWLRFGEWSHSGAVYLNGDWLTESPKLDAVLAPTKDQPMWFAQVDGADNGTGLVNIVMFQPEGGVQVQATKFLAQRGGEWIPCSEGGLCVGNIRAGNWFRYGNVDFGQESRAVSLRVASLDQASTIELRLDKANGELIGSVNASPTGGWQKWTAIRADIKPTSGKHTLCLLIKTSHTGNEKTTIWAQFKGVDPNQANVEINVRKTIFTPEKTGINFITVRGFTMCDAATNWAPPTAGQVGAITAYWSKGWIIENNIVKYSRCSGITLGKYSDAWDNKGATSEAYVEAIKRAIENGWAREYIGSHIVRNNDISFCGQAGINGSMGAAFSTITGNNIHDIHSQGNFWGYEIAGIKFHGAVDVTIADNHIYRTEGGIWLDWMLQGSRLTGNVLHDNRIQDLSFEVDHGPVLVDNNLFLSGLQAQVGLSQGCAFVHNLITWHLWKTDDCDNRQTPYLRPHATSVAGYRDNPRGDTRFYNNILAVGANLLPYERAALPVTLAGNVFLKGAVPSKLEQNPLIERGFDASIKVVEKPDGWYLQLALDNAWTTERKRALVTTELLGKAVVPDQGFENPDGSAIKVDKDYFGRQRNADNPSPGPFEIQVSGTQSMKIWPKQN